MMSSALSLLIPKPADWHFDFSQCDQELLVHTASRHGLSALLYEALHREQLKLRAASHEQLRRQALVLLSAGMRIQKLTHAVLGAFEADGIPVVLLKGYGLASRLFPENPIVRPSSDVDVLVHPEHLEAARRACERLGLTSASSERFDFAHHHHVAMSRGASLVEIHFALFSGLGGANLSASAFFERSEAHQLLGHPVRFLAPEDELLYLCVHAANHSFLRLFWLVDIARFLLRYGLDFEVLLHRAQDANMAKAAVLALHLTCRYFGLELPPPLVRWPMARFLNVLFSDERLESAVLAQHRQGALLLRTAVLENNTQRIKFLTEGLMRWASRENRPS
jgi:hypothetical protein